MARVERLKTAPNTRYFLKSGESAALPIGAIFPLSKEKNSSISTRALKYGRGGEIRTPNTRIWNPLLCQLELHP